jgi:uncharacterized protein (DUF1501 family)
MQRRQFAGLMALSAGSLLLPLSKSAFAAVSDAPVNSPPRRLVVVFMRGAVDGLSIVVPYSDRNYYTARSTIAIARPGQDGGAIDLDGRFGLNPALSMMMPLWQSQRLAFVAAAGSPDATRSHFDAQDYMESGTPGRKGTPDGWMNRLLGVTPVAPGEAPSPMRAVAIGPTCPMALRPDAPPCLTGRPLAAPSRRCIKAMTSCRAPIRMRSPRIVKSWPRLTPAPARIRQRTTARRCPTAFRGMPRALPP